MDKYSIVVTDNETKEVVFATSGNAVLAMASSDTDVFSFFNPGEDIETEMLMSAAEEIFAGADGEK